MEDRFRDRGGSWEIQVWCSIVGRTKDEKKEQKTKKCSKTRAPDWAMPAVQAMPGRTQRAIVENAQRHCRDGSVQDTP